MINASELPINNEAHIASTGVWLYKHKKQSGKLVMNHIIICIKPVIIGQFWNLALKINQTSIIFKVGVIGLNQGASRGTV